jgi:dTDP-4-amino-4,6-dideoxygalactose transaminase
MDFIDLKTQQRRIRSALDLAIGRVLDHGAYVMGPEVRAFEAELAAFGQAKLALSCANGTDAVVLPLMAWGIGAGDAVFCPSFTFAATAEVIPWTGATPVFVDILPDTYNLDPAHLELAIEETLKAGVLKPAAVIAVDLFGQPADYPKIAEICLKHGLKLLADSAQGFGCTLHGEHPLHWADATSTSFFPAKPLGCYGDGGAVLVNDQAVWDVMDSLRVHGKGVDKYDNQRIGMNSRLDTLQAAVLLEKLKIFAEEITARNRIADRYSAGLNGHAVAPKVIEGGVSTWAQYTIEHPDRDGLAAHLKTKGVPTAAYYPRPVHRQSAYADFPVAGGVLPVTDEKAGVVLALPMSPYLSEADQDVILDAIRGYNG